MDDSTLYRFVSHFFIFYLPLLFSLCVHEWAHAWTAFRKGDTLAKEEGRLTLNPLSHADILGTVILPLFSIFTGLPVFGWAKPVPVNPAALSHPKNDLFWIAFAGPLSNFCLSIVGAMILFILSLTASLLSEFYIQVFYQLLYAFIYINLLLGFFNLIPLHPLDGGKVIARFLPVQWNMKLSEWESYSSLFLIALFVTGAFRWIVLPAVWITDLLVSFSWS